MHGRWPIVTDNTTNRKGWGPFESPHTTVGGLQLLYKDFDPSIYAMSLSISIYIFPNHQLLDVAGPLAVFETANSVSDQDLYDLQVVASSAGSVASSAGVSISALHVADTQPHTVLVAGGNIGLMQCTVDVAAIRCLAARARRIASVCTGAFLLAEAGLLDGRRATTHWARISQLRETYPLLHVQADCIFVQDANVWTSAGISTGIDLALALVEADHGAALAKAVSRELVLYQRRPGQQPQTSALSLLEPESDRIRWALTFAHEHLHEPLPVERLAEAARLSPRHFSRAFRQSTGESPARAIERLRVEAASVRLTASRESIEVIARAVGFIDPERMRRAFQRFKGMPPTELRKSRMERMFEMRYPT